jgi:hypothetical protein
MTREPTTPTIHYWHGPTDQCDGCWAEARAAVLRELREEVERIPGASPSGVCVFRAVVLEAIDRILKP